MISLFSWLRRKVSESIIGGVADALEQLDQPAGTITVTIPETLAARFTPPLPLFSEQARCEVEPVMPGKNRHRDVTSRMSGRDKVGRSKTPAGFAQAFFEVNR